MPQQSQSVADSLKALHDELKSAADKQDAQAKSTIRTALAHMEVAKTQLQAQMRDDDAKRKAQAEKTLGKLEEIGRNSKKALDETGADMHAHLSQMIASAKSALGSGT